jgi:hypothetical protein
MYALATDNPYDIPTLDSDLQPALVPSPVLPWGTKFRTRPERATWHFYTDDRKFAPLWDYPDRFLSAKPGAFVEPNFSIDPAAPRAVALYQIYKKRTLSVLWQKAGVPCLVDLNLPDRFLNLALFGVPAGWAGYATRGYSQLGKDDLIKRFQLAQTHSGIDKPYFLVYAGGKAIADVCRRRGWVYVPNYRGDHVEAEGDQNGSRE